MSFLFRAEAALARAALALLRLPGPVGASNLAGGVARALGPLLPVSRVADVNLRLAMPELDASARRRIVRGAWDSLGRTVGELPHVAALRETASGPGWEIAGAEHARELVERGGPAIFFSGHLGNWEVLPAALAARGLPMASMYRAASNPLVDGLILDLRRRAAGMEVPMFPKGAVGARQAMSFLQRGGILGLLMDQKMNDGIEGRLFGRPAMTAPALAVIALRLRCPVIPGHVERIGPARFRLVCEAPLTLPDSGDRKTDTYAVTQAVNDWLERWIRARPEQWLWFHRRWPKDLYRRAGRRRDQPQDQPT